MKGRQPFICIYARRRGAKTRPAGRRCSGRYCSGRRAPQTVPRKSPTQESAAGTLRNFCARMERATQGTCPRCFFCARPHITAIRQKNRAAQRRGGTFRVARFLRAHGKSNAGHIFFCARPHITAIRRKNRAARRRGGVFHFARFLRAHEKSNAGHASPLRFLRTPAYNGNSAKKPCRT